MIQEAISESYGEVGRFCASIVTSFPKGLSLFEQSLLRQPQGDFDIQLLTIETMEIGLRPSKETVKKGKGDRPKDRRSGTLAE